MLAAAQVRDGIITVSWSGDADVDLIVEEPTGSLCCSAIP